MTATAVDRDYTKLEGSPRALPVAASTTIYLGTAVAVTTSTGYATSLTDSALLEFMGVASEGVINTTAEGYGSAGDLNVRLATEGVFSFVSAGLAITDQGCDLYFADNQTVQKTPTNHYAGKLHRYTSATEALVDIGPALSVAPTTDDVDYLELPVAAAKTIAIGDNVGRDADGYVLPANDATSIEFVGVAVEAANNAAGADGDINCFVQRSGLVTMVTSGAAITDGDRPVFVNAAATVTLTPADRNLFVGVVAKYISATSIVVDLKPGMLGQCGDVVSVGVAATKTVTAKSMVCVDADGYLVDADDATAVSFWGIALTGAVNTAGADGALSVWVARSGLFQLTGAGLAATDVGKEVWQNTDASTVTTTPGTILIGHLEFINGATAARVNIKPLAMVGQRIDRQESYTFGHIAAAMTGKKAFEDREFGRRYLVLSSFGDLEVAPGGADTLTCELNDGTTAYALLGAGISAANVHAENKVAQVLTTATMKANTDTDATLTDAGVTSQGLKGVFTVEFL